MVDAVSAGTSGFESSDNGASKQSRVPPAQTLGSVLRQRREAMGVTLAEVEVATRIRQKYLAAIEADDWHLLPGEVVGRGFLRNYSDYLGLESHEVVDRRRAVTDPGLTAALATTSSGTRLPPERQVDYRPKEVELKDESDGIQRGDIRLTPILSIVGVALVVLFVWWAFGRVQEPASRAFSGIQSRIERMTSRDLATATPQLIGIVNSQNTSSSDSGNGGRPLNTDNGDEGNSEVPAAALLGLVATDTPTPEPVTLAPPTATPIEEPPTPTSSPPPTNTPEIVLPTATLQPTNTFQAQEPTPEPELPTDTPVPEPVVSAPVCADGSSVITSPGVGQVVSGLLPIMGTAASDALDYYKLEFAPGQNAAGGFVYFDGQSTPVSGGQLGVIDTRSLANGAYTIRVTAVDQTGNFPPPCTVSIVVQN